MWFLSASSLGATFIHFWAPTDPKKPSPLLVENRTHALETSAQSGKVFKNSSIMVNFEESLCYIIRGIYGQYVVLSRLKAEEAFLYKDGRWFNASGYTILSSESFKKR